MNDALGAKLSGRHIPGLDGIRAMSVSAVILGHLPNTHGPAALAGLQGMSIPLLTSVRGRGLWLALVVPDGTAGVIEQSARQAGYLVNAAAPDAVRLAPPLILSDGEADAFVAALPEILGSSADRVEGGQQG